MLRNTVLTNWTETFLEVALNLQIQICLSNFLQPDPELELHINLKILLLVNTFLNPFHSWKIFLKTIYYSTIITIFFVSFCPWLQDFNIVDMGFQFETFIKLNSSLLISAGC